MKIFHNTFIDIFQMIKYWKLKFELLRWPIPGTLYGDFEYFVLKFLTHYYIGCMIERKSVKIAEDVSNKVRKYRYPLKYLLISGIVLIQIYNRRTYRLEATSCYAGEVKNSNTFWTFVAFELWHTYFSSTAPLCHMPFTLESIVFKNFLFA